MPRSTNGRRSRETKHGEINSGNKVVSNKERRRNLSKAKLSTRVFFLILEAWIAFTSLKKTFTKVLILHYFDSEYHIYIEIEACGFSIGEMIYK